MAYRVSTLRQLGGFDEALGAGTGCPSGDDHQLFLRLLFDGRRIGYEPSSVVHHQHRRSQSELRTQLHNYGMGFAGVLTSLVIDDPKHLLRVLRSLPHWGRALLLVRHDRIQTRHIRVR